MPARFGKVPNCGEAVDQRHHFQHIVIKGVPLPRSKYMETQRLLYRRGPEQSEQKTRHLPQVNASVHVTKRVYNSKRRRTTSLFFFLSVSRTPLSRDELGRISTRPQPFFKTITRDFLKRRSRSWIAPARQPSIRLPRQQVFPSRP